MSYPHAIRLRGPWEFEVLCAECPVLFSQPAHGRCTMPADWESYLGRDFRGTVRYVRHFQSPTGLLPHDRVYLVCEGADARAEVSLNGQPLGEIMGYALAASFPLEDRLLPRNQLVIDVELPSHAAVDRPKRIERPGRVDRPGGLIGEVRLEIRTSQWIEGLCVFAAPRPSETEWTVRGRIGGAPAEGPLRVIVSDGRRDVRLDNLRVGDDFACTSSEFALPSWRPDKALLGELSVELCPGGPGSHPPATTEWLAAIRTAVPPRDSAPSQLITAVESADFYTDLDHRGIAAAQVVSVGWVERVAPRLAHHPCIVAIALEPSDAHKLHGSAADGQSLWGRPVFPLAQFAGLPRLTPRG